MSTHSQPRILLIGGSGFLGQHLVLACESFQMNVRVACRRLPDKPLLRTDVEHIQGDYRDPTFLHRILTGVDVVVHLAHDNIRLSVDCDMEIELARNVQPAIKLMDACLAAGIAKLVFVSSGGTVYGNRSIHIPITEDSQTHPISLYGASKLTIEQIGHLYHAQKGLPFIVARPTNAYGPGQFPFRGQGFIATAFASALEGRSLNIFGGGLAVRDYIHATDIAHALVALIQHGRVGETYNIGSASGLSARTLLEEYINPIVTADGFQLSPSYSPARGVDVDYNVVDNQKIGRDAGFFPSIQLKEGLRETWAWIKNLPTAGTFPS